jgi:hypothetical protein
MKSPASGNPCGNRRRAPTIAGLLLAIAAGGCIDGATTNVVWYEADVGDNAAVRSQGPGRTLILGCDVVGNGVPCTWTVRMMLRSSEALRSWSQSLLGEAGPDQLEVTAFTYNLTAFDTPSGNETFGLEPDLLVGTGASTGAMDGVPTGTRVLLTFELSYANPPNPPANRTILTAFGDAGWTAVAESDIPTLIQVAANVPFPAVGGSILPLPPIRVQLAGGAGPGPAGEFCADESDNDGDGLTDCDDPDCGASVNCMMRPRIFCPDDLVLECDGAGNVTDVDNWLASATFESHCNNVEVTNDYGTLGDACGAAGTALVTWRIHDDCGLGTCSARLTIEDTVAPSITVPDDLTFVCDGSGMQTELVDWLASASATDVCGVVAIEFARGTTAFDCTAAVDWTATDECGNATVDSALLTIEGDDGAPVLTLIGDVELTRECGLDPYSEPGATVDEACDTTLTGPDIGGAVVDTSTTGVYVVTYDAVDICGHEAERLERTVTVVDTLPPEAVPLSLALWPPNHQYDTLRLSDCARLVDACAGELDIDALGRILSIYSDEPENANGDGNTVNDIVIVDDSTFRLRVERRGGGNGRVYGVTFEAMDSAGHRIEDTCLVSVPHDQSGAPAVDDGAAVGYTVTP